MSESEFDPGEFAFLYFAISVLIVIFIPLTYWVFVTPLRSLRSDPKYKKAHPNLKQAMELDIQRNKFYKKKSYLWKSFFWVLISMVLFNAFQQLPDPELMRGFDPYEVLGVTQSTPVDQIKKSYRQLAREVHPDKHPDEQEKYSKLFNQITKAYQCLTDPRKIPNCKKYGNPDGFSGYTVGIALPAVPKEQQGLLLILLLVGFVMILLITLWSVFQNLGKHDKNGILNENRQYLGKRILEKQHQTFDNCVESIKNCKESKLIMNKGQSMGIMDVINNEYGPGIMYMSTDICLQLLKQLWAQYDLNRIKDISEQITTQIETIQRIIQYQSPQQHPGSPKLTLQLVGKEKYTTSDMFLIKAKISGLEDLFVNSTTFPVLRLNHWNIMLKYKNLVIGYRQEIEQDTEIDCEFKFVPITFERREIREFYLKVVAYADGYIMKLEQEITVKCQIEEEDYNQNDDSDDSDDSDDAIRKKKNQKQKQKQKKD